MDSSTEGLGFPARSRNELDWKARSRGLTEWEIREEPVDLRIEGKLLWQVMALDHYDIQPREYAWTRPCGGPTNVGAYLYIVRLPEPFKKVMEAARVGGAESVYCCSLREFWESPGEAVFRNPFGRPCTWAAWAQSGLLWPQEGFEGVGEAPHGRPAR